MLQCCTISPFACCRNAAGYEGSPRHASLGGGSEYGDSECSDDGSPGLYNDEPSWDSFHFPPIDYGAAKARVHDAGLPKRQKVAGGGQGVLGPVVDLFVKATEGLLDEKGVAEDILRVPFIDGVEAYARALDAMGGGMGSYLTANTKKMRGSKASDSETRYRLWMLSELPVHAAAGYGGYVDESAWMANLWIGWTMEFFVEFYAQLSTGQDTKPAVEVAYKQTLSNHHNMFQRTAFNTAVRQLPERAEIIKKLRGGADDKTVVAELAAFAAAARPVVAFCLKMNDEVSQTLQDAAAKARGK